jgi:hypothetical protein
VELYLYSSYMPSWRRGRKTSLLLKYKSKYLRHCTAPQVSERLIHGVQTDFMHGKGKGRVSPLQKCHTIKGYRKKQSSTQYLSRQSMRLISFRLRQVYFRRKASSVNVTTRTWKRRSRIQTLSTSAGEITESTPRIILQINFSVARRAGMHRVTTTREKLGTHLT